jgi:hypothetical protein
MSRQEEAVAGVSLMEGGGEGRLVCNMKWCTAPLIQKLLVVDVES